MNDEPSVLDYVKALLTPWRGAPPRIPGWGADAPPRDAPPEGNGSPGEAQAIPGWEPTVPRQMQAQELLQPTGQLPPPALETVSEAAPSVQDRPITKISAWPWRSLVSLGLALFAQRSLEPGLGRSWIVGALFYLLAVVWLVWGNWRGEWSLPGLPAEEPRTDPLTVRSTPLWIGILLCFLAFLTLGGNRFTSLNVALWVAATVFIVAAFWQPLYRQTPWAARARAFLSRPVWRPALSRWTLFVLAAVVLVIFFRIYRLEQVPPEMVSDHAEKLLDIWDVLHGETRIFFLRNTGREALQMYLTAGVIRLFGTGYSFLSMKIGTALAGLLTLVYMYLLGKETGNSRAGLLAMVFAGIAYWPNVITRMGLRFTFYPLFVAPTLYYLIRGLRRSNRNDFILAGIFLGLGLHGYTPFRIMPIMVLVAVGLYLLHRHAAGLRKQTVWNLAILAFLALVVFLPLMRFWVENPDLFGYRAFTRLGTVERPLPEPALAIFLKNLWNALVMFSWSNGEIWPVSIPYRPALDIVTAALFHLGVVLLLVRYLRRRRWVDLFLLLSIPLLMMPSILSLAFPSENPALNRAAGALVPVFLIVGLALDGLLNALTVRRGARLAWGAGLVLLALAAFQNYDLVFNQYQRNYSLSAWNSSEIGQAIQAYAGSLGELDSAFVVAYPHWVDTRLVGINAGYPTKDYALWPEHFPETQAIPEPKLFVIYPQDNSSLEALQLMYPQGYLKVYSSRVENKDFWLYYVLPEK